MNNEEQRQWTQRFRNIFRFTDPNAPPTQAEINEQRRQQQRQQEIANHRERFRNVFQLTGQDNNNQGQQQQQINQGRQMNQGQQQQQINQRLTPREQQVLDDAAELWSRFDFVPPDNNAILGTRGLLPTDWEDSNITPNDRIQNRINDQTYSLPEIEDITNIPNNNWLFNLLKINKWKKIKYEEGKCSQINADPEEIESDISNNEIRRQTLKNQDRYEQVLPRSFMRNIYSRREGQNGKDFGKVTINNNEENYGYNKIFYNISDENLNNPDGYKGELDAEMQNVKGDINAYASTNFKSNWFVTQAVEDKRAQNKHWMKSVYMKDKSPYKNRSDNSKNFIVHVLVVADAGVDQLITIRDKLSTPNGRTERDRDPNKFLHTWFKKYFTQTIIYIMATSIVYEDYHFKFFGDLHDIDLFNIFDARGEYSCGLYEYWTSDRILHMLQVENMIGSNCPEDKKLIENIKIKILFMRDVLKTVYGGTHFSRSKLFDLIYFMYTVAWCTDIQEEGVINRKPSYNREKLSRFEYEVYDLGLVSSQYKGLDRFTNSNIRLQRHRDANFIGTVVRGLVFRQTGFHYGEENSIVLPPNYFLIRDAHRCPCNMLDKENTKNFLESGKAMGWTLSINYIQPWHMRDVNNPWQNTRGPIFYRVCGRKVRRINNNESDVRYNMRSIMTREEYLYTFGRVFILMGEDENNNNRDILFAELPVMPNSEVDNKEYKVLRDIDNGQAVSLPCSGKSFQNRWYIPNINKAWSWHCRKNYESINKALQKKYLKLNRYININDNDVTHDLPEELYEDGIKTDKTIDLKLCPLFGYGIDEYITTFICWDNFCNNYYHFQKPEVKRASNFGVNKEYMQGIYENSELFQMSYSWDVIDHTGSYIPNTKERRAFLFLFLVFVTWRTVKKFENVDKRRELLEGRKNREVIVLSDPYDWKSQDYWEKENDFSIADLLYFVDTLRDKPPTPAIATACRFFPKRTHIHAFAGYTHEADTEEWHNIGKTGSRSQEFYDYWPYIMGRALVLFTGCFKKVQLSNNGRLIYNNHDNERVWIMYVLGWHWGGDLANKSYTQNELYGKWVEKVIEGNMGEGDHAFLSALSDRTGTEDLNEVTHEVTEEEEDLIINLFMPGTSDNQASDVYHLTPVDRREGGRKRSFPFKLVDFSDNNRIGYYSIHNKTGDDFKYALKWSDNAVGNDQALYDIVLERYDSQLINRGGGKTDIVQVDVPNNKKPNSNMKTKSANTHNIQKIATNDLSTKLNEKNKTKEVRIKDDNNIMSKNEDFNTIPDYDYYNITNITKEDVKSHVDRYKTAATWINFLDTRFRRTINDYIDPLLDYEKSNFKRNAGRYFNSIEIAITDYEKINFDTLNKDIDLFSKTDYLIPGVEVETEEEEEEEETKNSGISIDTSKEEEEEEEEVFETEVPYIVNLPKPKKGKKGGKKTCTNRKKIKMKVTKRKKKKNKSIETRVKRKHNKTKKKYLGNF